VNSTATCPRCGAVLATSADHLLYCPACVLRQGLQSSIDTQPAAAEEVRPPPVFGTYELLEKIGRGGMGVVYKARQRNLKRTVAIKLLVAGAYSSEALLRRFQLEAEAAAGLQHPGIVAVHEFGENDHQPFYAMEYVEGRNLAEVSGGQPLGPKRAATYLKAIAEAVHYAHEHGILHRDLKPSNVLIDQDDRPRITDFGLAKQLHAQSDFSLAGQMVGSPNYASPEQSGGRLAEVGVASDLYSLGALLYHLLTGRPPFLATSVQETLRLVADTDPIPPSTLNPDVPPDLNTICLKCLEKLPARRYATAQALAEELGRFLRGEPILARPVSATERTWRWGRRHPAIASLAAMVVLALTVTSVVFYTSARRIERARDREQAARLEAEQNLYAANMQVMSRAFTSANGADPRGMRESLNQSRPRPGERDYRGFEWRHFWRRTQSDALATLSGHAHVVDAAFFSPDGRYLATHSLDGTLKLWDAATMRELHSLGGVAVAGGFTADGGRIICSKFDNSLVIFDVATGRAGPALPPGGRLIAALPDGQHVVVFGPDQRPLLRDLTATSAPAVGKDVPIDTCAVVSADGRRAAVAGRPYPGLLVVDLATGRELAALVDPRPVIGLALSPDGQRLVSAGFDGVLKIWDVEHGTLEHTIAGFVDPAWALAFSPDGRSLAAAGNNRELKIWDTTTWEELEELRGHSTTVRCVAFSPDGARLVSGAEDDSAMVWPTRANHAPEVMTHLLRGPRFIDQTPGIDFSPDSKLLAGTAADGTVKVWRTDTMAEVASYPMDARTVVFAADGTSVLGASYDGVIRRFMLGTSGPEVTLNPRASFANWQVDSLTPRERVTFVADRPAQHGECRLCEIPSARDGINAGAILSTPTIAMAPDGRTMFVGLPQGSVEVWDVATRQLRFTFLAHKLNVTALAVSPDGRYLATGSLDNSTKLWDAVTGNSIAVFHVHNRPVWALAFSPDGQTLAAGSCDKEIILCSVPLRQHVAGLSIYFGIPKGYEQEIRLLRFSPDGTILAAALGDGTLRFFRAATFAETDASVAVK